ncbi:3-hydroxy-9,10-secoandrosta-1,3,5(10)-triene-9,17-dione monooxygenase [Actinoalloteichus hoggarensis]|uniref:Flavin-dependent monooxygenase, oxygenase subunit HsaA n=1 Tax=Actinoalloteichus hoggarensis TaxID=1470176 RepID=A0A221W643_9PSEU|nr:acyl-CoA dehydrogenase family protein [Actinoalloteichus hoggarensis]ASO20917.1 Flavin-dependent monooxygenase, oxygenase subunit HsaA [Actinoalloteichus hoggarensis]MBB5920847.1 3-hydroxy-9,10-secoandrosta-1,3,5(10)-triene-9,17-dione monooxygenase [Actinoalloteichus hoggarensis]
MSVATNAPSDDPSPAGPQLTEDEVVARAERLARTLVDRQAETEQRTFYAEDVHEQFRAAGFYRILVPRRFGGHEFSAETFLRVSTALARGCPSTGWMYCLGAAHALAAATFFDERAQTELFADGDFISPATINPSGSARRADDGGWIIRGTWPYCSGAPYATHFIGHTIVESAQGAPGTPLLFIIPRSGWTMLNDWGDQLGLQGSGSHSIRIDDAYVPPHHALESVHLSEMDVSRGTVGRRLHGNPEYGGGPLSFMLLESASLAVGMAQGALDAYEELMRTRKTMFAAVLRAEDPDYQLWYGQAGGMIAAAEAAVRNAAQQWSAVCAAGPSAFTREQDLRIATICREVIRLCWQAVEGYLFRTAGSSSVRLGSRIERVWRDMSTLHSHVGVGVLLASVATREFTKARFGVR